MREIVLDTETTGLDPKDGHRIVEIAGVELLNSIPTGDTFHVYINPERDMPDEAFRVHGLGSEFLSSQPVFSSIHEAFLQFIGDSPLVIHNAEFDMRFLNAELTRLGCGVLAVDRAIDTLALARRKHPGASNSLDALCGRYKIDSSKRTKHGALLDAQLLAEVYGELIGGRQSTLILIERQETRVLTATYVAPTARDIVLDPRIRPEEESAHRRYVEGLGSSAIWWQFLDGPADV